jgi:hypothetical protein
MINVEYRHTNFHSQIQILEGQNSLPPFRIFVSWNPMSTLRRTLGLRVTQFEKHWYVASSVWMAVNNEREKVRKKAIVF